MAKRFKLRICRVIATTFQSCRSKNPSILPEDPAPSFSRLNPNDQNHGHRRPSFKHHVSSAFISIGACGLPPNKQTPDDHLKGTRSQEFKWQKEEKWHVVAKICEQPTPRRKICSSSEDDLSFAQPMPPAPPPSSAEKNRRRGKKKKKKNNVPSCRLRMSTSSADSGWFSSEGGAGAGDERDEEETETLVSSSLSFSTDSSSEFNPHSQLQPIRETQPFTTNLPHRRNKRRVSKSTKRGVLRPPSAASAAAAEVEIPARLSMFKKLIPCTVEGKVKESFAIVKRSEDPYKDFKNSMMDMILEKQMFDPKDLEQLLQCFLSLNSRHYHGIIIQAFSEIWESIFSPSGSKPSIQNHRRVSRPASF